MAGNNRAGETISSLRALVFAIALSLALIAVLVPVLPGEAPLQAGEAAYKNFQIDGQVIVERGRKHDPRDVVEAKRSAIEDRAIVDEKILANLLRLNLARAAAQHSADV